jgi:hypothetical protein
MPMPLEISFEPREAATLLMPSGPGRDPSVKHLFIIVIRPCAEQRVALVNITFPNLGINYDDSCILDVGDHPFIIKPSMVFYRRAIIETVLTLKQGVLAGEFIPRPPMQSSAFKRICAGSLLSQHVRPRVKSYVQAQFAMM